MSEVEVVVFQQIDRLVSASTPSDALSSLSSITQSLSLGSNNNNSNNSNNNANQSNDEKEQEIMKIQTILAESEEFMNALCSLLSESSLPSINIAIDGGDAAACEFLDAVLASLHTPSHVTSTMEKNSNNSNSNSNSNNARMSMKRNAQLKKFLSDGRLTHALLDLLSGVSTSPSSIYAKTSAIQILSKLTYTNPTLLHSQILSAPDGLPRIIDLLNVNVAQEQELEPIRNEALLLCTIMARTNAGSARLMIFGETYEKVFDIATGFYEDDANNGNGSLLNHNAIQGDCLRLCIEMTRQDEMGSEVFLGSHRLVRDLIKFLDLRLGSRYRDPDAGGLEVDVHGESDDLDDILNGHKSNSGTGIGGSNDKSGTNAGGKPKKSNIPFLTEEEGELMMLALDLLHVLIIGDESIANDDPSKKRARQKSVLSHDILARLLIDMALYTLPPPDSPPSVYVSGVPTLNVQLKALDVMATLAQDCGEEMQQVILAKRGIYLHAGLMDRLMYLICTGDGANRIRDGDEVDNESEADQISMHCLGVLRCLLSAKEASTIMMHTLAPPPPEDNGMPIAQMEAPVVQKLVNTLGENLHVLLNEEICSGLKEEDERRIARMIIGSAGALGIFLTNGAGETTREMLLRVPNPPPPGSGPGGASDGDGSSPSSFPSLVECMISYIETCSNDKDAMKKNCNVIAALLRLFIEWVPSNPRLISDLLSSASSIALGVLLQQKYDKADPPTVQAMSAVLLGLCMDNMKAGDEMGGWSISSIMNLINVGLGIGKFTQLLETLKVFMADAGTSTGSDSDGKSVGPWTCCAVERTHLMVWYKDSVNAVRKRAVQELTLPDGSNSDSDGEDEGQSTEGNSRDARAMKKLVSQQTAEIEELRSKLAQAEESLSEKSAETKTLKKRLESNPSQLDDMLNECTSKISQLEIQNRTLSSKITFMENDFKESLRQKDEAASELKKGLDQAQAEIKNLEDDKKMTDEELTGLTTAYTNLEGEYNRVVSQNGTSSQPNGDDTSEGVMPMSSYQIMKDENAKLKTDIRAANDWMKKAVKKMDESGKRNSTLEAKLKSALAANKDQATLHAAEMETSKSGLAVLSAAGKDLAQVKADRDMLSSEVVTLRNELAATRQKIEDLEASESSENADIEKLSTQVVKMREQMESDNKQYMASIAGLEKGLASKDQIISGLESKLSEAEKTMIEQSKSQDGSSDDAKKLKDEIIKLTKANESAQEWMKTAVKHHSSLKKQVQELKKENNKLSSELKKQDNSSADANKLHPDLQTQINAALMDRDNARKEMVELEAKLIDLETSEEKKVSEMQKEVTVLKSQLVKREQDFQALSDKIGASQAEYNLERQQFFEDKVKLEGVAAQKEGELETMKKELEGLKRMSEVAETEYDGQSAAVSQMSSEIQIIKEENENLLSQRDEHIAAIEDMKNRLTEFHSWTETAQQRIGELEGEKDTSESRILELEQDLQAAKITQEEAKTASENILKQEERIRELEENLKAVQVQYDESQVRLQSLQNLASNENSEDQTKDKLLEALEKISEFENEKRSFEVKIQELEDFQATATANYDGVQLELQASKSEYSIVKDIADKRESELNRLWTEVSEARKRILDLEEEKVVLETKIRELDENGLTAEVQCEELQIELQNSKDEFDAMKEMMGSEEEVVVNLKSQLLDAQNQISELRANTEVSLKKIEDLEAENDRYKIKMEEMEKEQLAAKKVSSEEIIVEQARWQELQSEISDLQMQLGDLDGRNRALSEENKVLEQTNSDLLGKSELLDEVEENLFEKEAEATELTNALASARHELSNLQDESQEAISAWKEKSAEFESEVHRLEIVVSDQQDEAKEAISLWEERCSSLEAEIAKWSAEGSLEELKLQLSTLHEDVASLTANLEIEKGNVETLSKEKLESETIFKGHIDELEVAIGEHISTNEQIQIELDSKEDALAAAQDQIELLTKELCDTGAQSEEVVIKWQENNEELENTVSELENTIATQNAEATAAIGQWEARCNALSEQVQTLEAELVGDELHQLVEELKIEVADKEQNSQRYQEECKKLKEAEKCLSLIVETLEKEKVALEGSLSVEKDCVAKLNVKMEETLSALESEKLKLAQQKETLDTELKTRQDIETSLKSLQTISDKTKAELDQIQVDREDLIQKLRTKEEETTEKLCSIEDQKSRLQEALHSSESEINELKMIIGQLEVELTEANDALQSHLTDEVTIRATEKAAAALRSQIKEMREKQIFDKQAYSNEKEARLAADEEIERLKMDLALLAKTSNGSGDGKEAHIQQMASKAAAEVMFKEREEIESLRKSVEHVMNELKASRLKEREAEDRAANSRMHASVCEQELLSLKADISFLNQSLSEARKSESEMQSLLENRIKALEEDRQTLMSANRADFEAMKAELSNTIIERDQLIHALNESEKANSTLVYSTTVDDDKENLTSMQVELSKLRMENAQLLSAASKNAAQTERRIRSVLAGDASTVEEEVETDKKRCKEAVQSLEKLQEQYDDVSKELGRMKSSNDDLISKLKHFEANNVEDELKKVEADFSKLELEKLSLQSKLKETETSLKSDIAKLEEKCKTSDAKIRKLESAEHKEAALAAEVARIREETSGRNGSISAATSFDDMESNTERKGPEIEPGDQLDLIRELQSEMTQERELYQELLTEHEDLLALLAQQDCEKKCLQEALQDANGKAAVDRAILKAEEKVVQQFGKYVQIK